MLSNYIPIALMMVIAVGFGVLMVNLSKWIGPRRPNTRSFRLMSRA